MRLHWLTTAAWLLQLNINIISAQFVIYERPLISISGTCTSLLISSSDCYLDLHLICQTQSKYQQILRRQCCLQGLFILRPFGLFWEFPISRVSRNAEGLADLVLIVNAPQSDTFWTTQGQISIEKAQNCPDITLYRGLWGTGNVLFKGWWRWSAKC